MSFVFLSVRKRNSMIKSINACFSSYNKNNLEELYRWHFERNINHIFTCTCLVIACLTCWQLTWVKNINGLFQKFIFQILLQLVQSSPFPIYKNNLQHSSGYDSCRWRAKVIQAFDGLLLQFGSSNVSQ